MRTFPQAPRSRFALQSILLLLFSIYCLVGVGGARAGAVTALSSVSLSPTTIVGGTVVPGTIALTGAAPATGVSVIVTSSNTNIAVLASPVAITSGAVSKTFAISTKPVAVLSTVTIKASYGGVVKTITLTVTPPILSTMAISPVSVLGGSSSIGSIRMTGFAATRVSVTVTSSNTGAATVVSPVVIAIGAYYNSFAIATKPVSVNTVVTLSATYAGVTKTATLTVTPLVFTSIALAPHIVIGGKTSVVTVTLNGPAPAAGASFTLRSSSAALAPVASPLVIPAGAASKTYTIVTKALDVSADVTITATYGGVTRSAVLTLAPSPPPPPPMRASVARAFRVTPVGPWTGTITRIDPSGHTIFWTGEIKS